MVIAIFSDLEMYLQKFVVKVSAAGNFVDLPQVTSNTATEDMTVDVWSAGPTELIQVHVVWRNWFAQQT